MKKKINKEAFISKEHSAYLKSLKKRKILINAIRAGVLIFLIGIWELSARLKLIDTFIMSSPSRIVTTIADLLHGDLFMHIGITLFETLAGFAIATVVGVLFAIFMWWSKIFSEISEPYLVVLNSLPKIALGPIIIIWFGAGYNAIIAMTVLISIIITIITAQSAFVSVDRNKVLLMRSMGAKKPTVFLKLIFPSSLPTLISMLKINIGLSFVGSIMGEYLVSKAGLGYLIVYGGQVFNLDLVLACTILLMVLAAALYFLLALLERLSVKYQ